jgi:hypothetical protein
MCACMFIIRFTSILVALSWWVILVEAFDTISCYENFNLTCYVTPHIYVTGNAQAQLRLMSNYEKLVYEIIHKWCMAWRCKIKFIVEKRILSLARNLWNNPVLCAGIFELIVELEVVENWLNRGEYLIDDRSFKLQCIIN